MNICKQHRCFLFFSSYPLLKASESLFRHHVDIECLDRIFDNPFIFLANFLNQIHLALCLLGSPVLREKSAIVQFKVVQVAYKWMTRTSKSKDIKDMTPQRCNKIHRWTLWWIVVAQDHYFVLGGGFRYFCIFTPAWGRSSNLTSMFFWNELVQPPTAPRWKYIFSCSKRLFIFNSSKKYPSKVTLQHFNQAWLAASLSSFFFCVCLQTSEFLIARCLDWLDLEWWDLKWSHEGVVWWKVGGRFVGGKFGARYSNP